MAFSVIFQLVVSVIKEATSLGLNSNTDGGRPLMEMNYDEMYGRNVSS